MESDADWIEDAGSHRIKRRFMRLPALQNQVLSYW